MNKQLLSVVSQSPNKFELLKKRLEEVIGESYGVPEIFNPAYVRPKGRPRKRRIKGGFEKSSSKKLKK